MKWASATSQAARLEDALDESLETLAEELDGGDPDVLIAFASQDYLSHLSRLWPHVAERHPGAVLVGCSAAGVVGGGHEIEGERALSLTAAILPGVEARTFHLGDDPNEWLERIGVSADEEPVFVLLADPFTSATEDLLYWFDAAFPDSVKVGGLASGGQSPGSMALLSGTTLAHSGVVGLAMVGNIEASTIVAQGCRPIGTPLFVTRLEDSLVVELDGEPALTVLEALYKSLPPEDQGLFRDSLFVGLVMDRNKQEYRQGDFLIRQIAGVVPRLGALRVAGDVVDRQVIQFHLRDRETSTQDLSVMLAAHDPDAPAGALMFSCVGRGFRLYGRHNHDSSMFRARFGDLPLGGFFGNGEIGPVDGRTFLHGYTSAFGIFGPRR